MEEVLSLFEVAMAGSLKTVLCVSGFNGAVVSPKQRGRSGVCSSVGPLRFKESKPREAPHLATGFMGTQVIVSDRNDYGDWRAKSPGKFSVHVCIPSFYAINSICSFGPSFICSL